MPATVTYTFSPGANVESAKFNQNYTDLCNYINENVVLKNGSVAFTGVPTGPGIDPSTANHLVRKAYVDGRTGVLQKRVQTSDSANFASSITDLGLSLSAFTMPTLSNGKALRISMYVPWCALVDTTGADWGTGGIEVWMRIQADGGAVNQVQKMIVPLVGSALVPDKIGGFTIEKWYFDNATYTAGQSLVVDFAGRLEGGGTARLQADSDYNIQIVAAII